MHQMGMHSLREISWLGKDDVVKPTVDALEDKRLTRDDVYPAMVGVFVFRARA